jgi:transglutaminase-like putative cysteine protease
VVSVPSALDVLSTRRGDCNEHAVLAVALLRAAGVPARMAAGLAYQQGAFYYHAWVEYWQNGWRTMDPTWGQLPADLGHIRLVAGGVQRQLDLVEVFQHIDVELAE